MSKSALYVVNNSTQEVVTNGLIDPGAVIRRFGPGASLVGNGVQLNEQGYYSLNLSITLAATEAGEVEVTVLKDGVALPGAIATQTAAAAGDFVNLSIDALIRNIGCCYTGPYSTLTFELTGVGSSVTNFAAVVIKL